MQRDAVWLFSHFWWLIFPLFWMVMGMFRLWLRHSRANRTIDILKSYADQGKDPPPELLAALRSTDFAKFRRVSGGSWIPFFLFVALTAGFTMLGLSADRHEAMGLFFVAIVMGGLAVGFLVTALTHRRDRGGDSPQ